MATVNENLKEYALHELNAVRLHENLYKTPADVLEVLKGVLGAVMFAQMYLDVPYDELGWYDEIRAEFYALAESKRR
jgi:hypothetical protein